MSSIIDLERVQGSKRTGTSKCFEKEAKTT